MRRCERVETSLAFLLSLAVVLGGCAGSAARGSGAEEGDSKVEPRSAPVVVACRGELWSFELDYATGALTKRSVVSGGYVINEKDSTLTSYRYDAPSGRLLDPESISTVPSEYLGDNGPAHVVVSPSGRFVYGSNRGHDSIVIYAVDPTTGRLRLVGHETAGGLIKFPRSFTLSPDGTRLLVANENSDSLLVFVVGEDGRIDPMGPPVPSGAKPSFVQVLR